jgi:hypothetical protein
LESHILPWFWKPVKGWQIKPFVSDLERQPEDFNTTPILQPLTFHNGNGHVGFGNK